MPRQRPVRPSAGAVAFLRAFGAASLGALVLTSCGTATGPVEVATARLDPSASHACESLVADLPARVSGQPRRDVAPAGAPAAAWGDPAIVLRCGVGRPAGYRPTSTCQVVNGVGWFIPDRQITGQPTDIVMTTLGREHNVEVRLPADYWPPAAAMVDLSRAIKKNLAEVRPCL